MTAPMDQEKIVSAAQTMIDSHGSLVFAVVARRIEEAIARSDLASAEFWRAVGAMVDREPSSK